jgi:hypothetical protein
MSSHHSHHHDHHHTRPDHGQDEGGHHHHGQDGHHDHHHGADSPLSFEEKLVRIFDHWVKHNESHAQTYADWREKAKAHGMDGIAGILDETARLSEQLTEKLKEGLNKAQQK